MKERSSSLIKNTSILSFGTLCTKGIMFIMTPLFTRWLTTEEYGTFDLMTTYISLLLPAVTLSISEGMFRFLLEESNERTKKEIISTAAVTEVVGLSIVLIGFMAFMIGTGKFNNVWLAFVLYFVCEVGYRFLMMLLRGEKQLKIYTLGNMVFVFGMAISVAVIVGVFRLGLSGILFGYAVGDVWSIITMLLISKTYQKINLNLFSKQWFQSMVRYSIPMIPNAISWWIVNTSDRTIIAIAMGASANAVYAIANKVPALCTTFFSVFHLSWQQSATESMSDDDRDQYYNSVMNNMFCVVSSICILIMGINYWFFKLLFAESYHAGIYQSPILTLALIFSMLGQFIGGIYVAQKKSTKNGLTTLMAAIVNIMIDILLINKLGLYAASLSTLVAYFVLFAIRFADIRRKIKLCFSHKSIMIACVFIYFFIGSYFLSDLYQAIQVVLALVVFIVINLSFMKKILAKINILKQ